MSVCLEERVFPGDQELLLQKQVPHDPSACVMVCSVGGCMVAADFGASEDQHWGQIHVTWTTWHPFTWRGRRGKVRGVFIYPAHLLLGLRELHNLLAPCTVVISSGVCHAVLQWAHLANHRTPSAHRWRRLPQLQRSIIQCNSDGWTDVTPFNVFRSVSQWKVGGSLMNRTQWL